MLSCPAQPFHAVLLGLLGPAAQTSLFLGCGKPSIRRDSSRCVWLQAVTFLLAAIRHRYGTCRSIYVCQGLIGPAAQQKSSCS